MRHGKTRKPSDVLSLLMCLVAADLLGAGGGCDGGAQHKLGCARREAAVGPASGQGELGMERRRSQVLSADVSPPASCPLLFIRSVLSDCTVSMRCPLESHHPADRITSETSRLGRIPTSPKSLTPFGFPPQRIDAAGKGAISLLNRDLKEEARSEDETNLCPSVAFGPDGGLIAASQV